MKSTLLFLPCPSSYSSSANSLHTPRMTAPFSPQPKPSVVPPFFHFPPKKQSLASYLLGSYRCGGVLVASDGVHEVEMIRKKPPRAAATSLPFTPSYFPSFSSFFLYHCVYPSFIVCLFCLLRNASLPVCTLHKGVGSTRFSLK